MTLSKSEKLGIILIAINIFIVAMFFTVGRSKENYRNINTYWEDKAFRLPFASIKEKERAKREVKEAPNKKKKYQWIRYNLLVAQIRTEKRKTQGKPESTKLTKLKDKLNKLKAKKNARLGR